MLYKKIHRQYVREFRRRLGRKFKYEFISGGGVYKVTSEPFINPSGNNICVKFNDDDQLEWPLISMIDSDYYSIGARLGKDYITWLD